MPERDPEQEKVREQVIQDVLKRWQATFNYWESVEQSEAKTALRQNFERMLKQIYSQGRACLAFGLDTEVEDQQADGMQRAMLPNFRLAGSQARQHLAYLLHEHLKK